jgi:IS30 family transposase
MSIRIDSRFRVVDRKIIGRMHKAVNSHSRITTTLGSSQSAIIKELKLHRGQCGYHLKQTNRKTVNRQGSKRVRECVMSAEVKTEVNPRLKRNHRPNQFSQALRPEKSAGPSQTIIYNYVETGKQVKGDMQSNLQINSKRRYQQCKRTKRYKLSDHVNIVAHTMMVEHRLRHGEWEVYLIAGCRSRSDRISYYERKIRLSVLRKLMNKDAHTTALRELREYSITDDNGLNFAGHQQVCDTLAAAGYFCCPNNSWEKAGVENSNEIVRQYSPNRTHFLNVSDARRAFIESKFYWRPSSN